MYTEQFRCLIGTLYVGENELAECQSSLYRQTFKNWDQFRIDYRSEEEAHSLLYERFMENREEYDFFIKLDPDMVLNRSTVLEEIIHYFCHRPSLDHACFSVYDYMSQQSIMGLHVFTNRVSWRPIENSMYPDQAPDINGEKVLVWNSPAPVAMHAPNPTYYQAFHFGAHRMLKALNARGLSEACYHWDTVCKIHKHSKKSQDPRLLFALIGAWHVWKGDININAKEALDGEKRQIFDLYSDGDERRLYETIPKNWELTLRRHLRMKRSIRNFKNRLNKVGSFSNSFALKQRVF